MERLIETDKIEKLINHYRKPLAKSCSGELLPNLDGYSDFMNVKKKDYFSKNSDINKVYKAINKYCPIALVSGITEKFNPNNKNDRNYMSIGFEKVQIDFIFEKNNLVETEARQYNKNSKNPIVIKFKGNNVNRIFRNNVVKNNIEYAILNRALKEQYSI